MADWDDDSPELISNLRRLTPLLRQHALLLPTAEKARNWHRIIMHGLQPPEGIPEPFAGVFRGEAPLSGYNVKVGDAFGVEAGAVSTHVVGFIAALRKEVLRLDVIRETAARPGFVEAVLTLCAQAHAQWVFIHPFANGNGRTARCWVLYLCNRHGLLHFLFVRPRPGRRGYAYAAEQAMQNEWRPTYALFKEMLAEAATGK